MKKKFLMFIFFLISYNSYSQVHIDLGGGATIKKEIYNKGEVTHRLFPNIEIVVGYETKFLIIQAEMKPSITRNTSASSYFGGAAGFKIGNFILEGGMYRNIISEDDPTLNNWKMGAALEYFAQLMKRGGIYGKGMYINNSFIFTSGFRININ